MGFFKSAVDDRDKENMGPYAHSEVAFFGINENEDNWPEKSTALYVDLNDYSSCVLNVFFKNEISSDRTVAFKRLLYNGKEMIVDSARSSIDFSKGASSFFSKFPLKTFEGEPLIPDLYKVVISFDDEPVVSYSFVVTDKVKGITPGVGRYSIDAKAENKRNEFKDGSIWGMNQHINPSQTTRLEYFTFDKTRFAQIMFRADLKKKIKKPISITMNIKTRDELGNLLYDLDTSPFVANVGNDYLTLTHTLVSSEGKAIHPGKMYSKLSITGFKPYFYEWNVK